MAKRSPGHIEQLPSGSWRVKVYGGTDPLAGREIRLRKTCKTERAALIELGKLLEQAAAGRQPETNATVAELMARYAEVADWDLSTRKANEALKKSSCFDLNLPCSRAVEMYMRSGMPTLNFASGAEAARRITQPGQARWLTGGYPE